MSGPERGRTETIRRRWRWVSAACVVAFPVLVWFTWDALQGSRLVCHRQPEARCLYRVGSGRTVIPLAGVTGARIHRRKIVGTFMIDLTFADGSTRRTLPDGRVREYHIGPLLSEAHAQAIVRRLQSFLRDAGQPTLTVRLGASARRVAVLFVGLLAILIIGGLAARLGWRRAAPPPDPTEGDPSA